jgi:Icc-related predicted phosphoesterase
VHSIFSRRTDVDSKPFRIYYASDFHGSRVCWRKFINAAEFYTADALVMGGDLIGKALVPITQSDSGYVARLGGEERCASTDKQLEELERAIRFNGFYPWRAEPKDVARLSGEPGFGDRVFLQVALAELREWIATANERLGPGGPLAYVMAGNDDPWEVDAVLQLGSSVVFCDERIVTVGDHELLSSSRSNRTPWDTARELDEDELYRQLRRLADQLESPHTAIFNLHVPPHNNGLDTAIELDETLAPVMRGGKPHEIPVGSHAVRQIIEEVQPVVSLHGHIHESRGITKIGRTVTINAGSAYQSGQIQGCLIQIAGDRLKSKALVSG